MNIQNTRRLAAISRELHAIARKEERRRMAALRSRPPRWKQELESKLPEKVYAGLESAFCKAFSLVFQKGSPLLEKTFRKEEILADHRVSDEAVRRRGSRSELRYMKKSAGYANLGNLTMTTVEGIGLGALGIGLPDIVLFIATLLKGIYETALHYGYSYESRAEQMLILKMMEASLASGEDWERLHTEVDKLLVHGPTPVSDEVFAQQLQQTASAFAMDMLLLKFIQGLPVVGILGGAANGIYYQKVMRSVDVKYRKRYLWQILKQERTRK
ncbi:MAG: EcsC family protein [Oscillospiraceae bacterium]|nr:EcsC family protein [Oscillospiraceae bacterium]